MRVAHALARRILPDHIAKFIRKDFTLWQLFASLVVHEMPRLSWCKAEALFRDFPQWLDELGMIRPPDHNTRWRAFGVLCGLCRINRILGDHLRAHRPARRKGEVLLHTVIHTPCSWAACTHAAGRAVCMVVRRTGRGENVLVPF